MTPPDGTPPRSPRAQQIVDVARELLEQDGIEGVSMRRIAERLGIRAPSLYEHVPGKGALEAALISAGFTEWAEAAEHAVDEGGEHPLAALARVYREFATAHPHLYRLMTERPLDREALDPGAEERAARPVVAAAGGDPDLARAFWSFAHGMTVNELNGRFPGGADLDAAWRRGVEAFAGGPPA